MQLSELIAGIPAQVYNMNDVDIASIEFDSRKIKAGAMYVAMKGAQFDGHDFVHDAVAAGAVALLTQKKIATELPQIVVNDTRAIMGEFATRFYGKFDELTKVGITGTNGKTTTAFLIRSILGKAGRKPGLIGTIYYSGKTANKATRTTPEIMDVLKLFKRFRDEGIDSVVMEVSSHALKMARVENIAFDVAVFTNLSQDHLDFHKTMDEYMKAKLHLLSLLKPHGYAVYNNDDTLGRAIKKLSLNHSLSYGRAEGSIVQARIIDQSLNGLRLEISYENKSFEIASSLIGDFNLYNILAAFASGIALTVDIEDIIAGIEELRAVQGRMECVADNIFVDFAHTPSAIESILRSLKNYVQGRLIIVFGCGGDRDKEKRPKMGAIATRLADLTVITTDNPRNETPMEIIKDIVQGVTSDNYKIIEDRTAAIRYAISEKRARDILVVAGKGHEEYQIIGDQVIHFNDAEVIRQCFANSC
jgi:UDP-N-acetylmuramoyl-L-alanyl-D-glutamate--2,6-diaminopimelate ligase